MCELPWSEFPILPDGSVYEGGRPGPDRVVYECVTISPSVITSGFIPPLLAATVISAVVSHTLELQQEMVSWHAHKLA